MKTDSKVLNTLLGLLLIVLAGALVVVASYGLGWFLNEMEWLTASELTFGGFAAVGISVILAVAVTIAVVVLLIVLAKGIGEDMMPRIEWWWADIRHWIKKKRGK